MAAWTGDEPGVMALPSGRLVRGRALRRPRPDSEAAPEFALHLLGRRPADLPEEAVWVRWPDFWVPRDRPGAAVLLREAHRRAASERVEIACRGGVGRTGTALACLVVLDGVPADRAVDVVRASYARRAVETPSQRWFVRWFDRWFDP